MHLLSFEVVLGAVVCNIMFWKLNKIPPRHSFAIVLILGFSVWIIYVLDRLLDNQKSDLNLTERHIFHQENAKILWYFIGLLTLICTILVFYLPINIIIFGIIISLLTGIYLLIISKISSKNNFQLRRRAARPNGRPPHKRLRRKHERVHGFGGRAGQIQTANQLPGERHCLVQFVQYQQLRPIWRGDSDGQLQHTNPP